MKQNIKTVGDCLDLIKRRKNCILATWLLVASAAVIVALNLPRIYRSTATLLIEAPIPAKYIESSVSQYGEEQIQSIYQRLLSTDNALSIIEANDLYSDIMDSYTPYELAELLRESTDVELAASSIAPQARSGRAEIAFNLSFSHSDPVKAQEIASTLASLFIEQNDKARTQRAVKASEFLTEETDKLNRELQEIDGKIAQYKERHSLSLPEQVEGNQAAIDRAENELRDTDNQIRATKERIAFLSAELARAEKDLPVSLDDKSPQSKALLRAKYLRFTGIYSPNHPSLMRLKRELEALDPSFEEKPARKDALEQLAKARNELKLLQKNYSGNHPDIAKLTKQIEKLERQAKSKPSQSPEEDSLQTFNPAFLNVEAQYKSSQSELTSLLQKQEYLKAKIENVHNILLQAPQVEMVYTDMLRARDNIIKKYTQLKEKWLDARLAQTLEEQQQGLTLTLIEQPIVPRNPEKATRRKVVMGGFFMGLAAGLGVAFLLELLEPGIRGYRAVREVTGLMPLVVVPYIESPFESEEQLAKQKRMKKILTWTAFNFAMLATVVLGLTFLGAAQT